MSLRIETNLNEIEELWTVKVIGEIDIESTKKLKEELNRISESGNYGLSFDCSDLEYIDSTGIGTFIFYFKRIKEKGMDAKFEFTNLRPNIYKIFRITGLDKIFTIR